ncbi:lysosomal alpha-mannosidase-like [Bombyx mandarina]|uniref:Alpha-mannosidase n=1 Tax=Bombyx mandarina TaxID=7092 RepID=A0A6J2JQT9_BOMMA|nr:lysosomal alpha-mannosidase-like [Bombyx mandarina]
MLNVHIVPHTHGELGYTRTFPQHYTGEFMKGQQPSLINMKRILDYTISELWAQEHRKFTFSDTPYLFHWWANRDATVRRMVYTLLRQGRLFIVGGAWGMVDEATTNYHAVIDQFTYSLRKLNATFLECGRPLMAWQADVYGHSREIASLLAQMGFDGLFINPISFDDELDRMRRKSMEFLWRGSDDLGAETDIYTHKLFDGYWSPPGFCFGSYCDDPLLITSDSVFRNIDERVDLFIKSILHRQAPYYSTRNVMVMMGQRFGYYDASIWFANVDKLINEVNKKSYETGANINLYYSTPACYLKAVYDSNPTLDTKQDDFFPMAYDKFSHATGLYTSRPTIKYMAREGHVYLQMAKQLQVLARLWNNDQLFEEFQWVMGAFQDHNIITGAMHDYVKEYYTDRMYSAVQRSTLLLKQAFNKLRRSSQSNIYYRCSFNESSCANTESPQFFIVIYNPLAWPVSVPARLPVGNHVYQVYGPKLEKINSSIVRIPGAILAIPERAATADHELVFMAENVPPLGFRSYYIERSRTRDVRSTIIKKIKNKNKKYLIRQVNPKMADENLMNDDDYYYDDVTSTARTANRIVYGDFGRHKNYTDGYVITPRPRNKSYESTTGPKIIDETTEIKITTIDDTDEVIQSNFSAETTAQPSTDAVPESDQEPSAVEKDSDISTDPRRSDIDNNGYVVSKDMFISNKYIRINLDSTRKITNLTLSNNVSLALDVQFYYYASDKPTDTGRADKKNPGVYLFRPVDSNPIPILDFIETIVYKTRVVEEIHCAYSDYVSFVARLYTDLPYIEVDWVVGPVPVEDGWGKDVFLRYTTDLGNDGAFYTDANGRQTLKRLRNLRATYEPVNMDAIPGNLYPVTSKIYIEDEQKNLRFSIFNDRAQGGTSLTDGELDLMIIRRILTDETGTEMNLNETEYDRGLIVRGKHILYATKMNHKPNMIYEKRLAKEISLEPKVLVSEYGGYGPYLKSKWLGETNEFSALKKKLPLGIHLLSIEQWNEATVLIRLENYLEKSDAIRSGIKRVYLRDVFVNLKIRSIAECALGGNVWLKDWSPLRWNKKTEFLRSFNEYYGRSNTSTVYADEPRMLSEGSLEKGLTLRPQQIRTFVVWFDYVDLKLGNVL